MEPDRRTRREEERLLSGDLRVELADRREVVQHPEGAAVRSDDEVAVLRVDVADRAIGQVDLQRLPVLAVVERDEDAGLGAGVEEALAGRVLPNDVDVAARGNPLRDQRPALPAVASPVDVRVDVVDPVPVDGRVDRPGVEVRGLEDADLRPGGEGLRRDVLPGFGVVPRDPDEAVVGAGPDQAVGDGREGEGVNDAAARALRVARPGGDGVEVGRDAGVLARQVGAEPSPSGGRRPASGRRTGSPN